MERPTQKRQSRKKISSQETAFIAPVEEHLRNALPEVRVRMEARLASHVSTPKGDSDLDHAGLRDGAQIVEEFLQAGEWGEAFHHLCYMVEQAQLPLSPEAYTALEKTGAAMHFDVSRWQGKVTVLPEPPAS